MIPVDSGCLAMLSITWVIQRELTACNAPEDQDDDDGHDDRDRNRDLEVVRVPRLNDNRSTLVSSSRSEHERDILHIP